MIVAFQEMPDAAGHAGRQARSLFVEGSKEAGEALFQAGEQTPECAAVINQQGRTTQDHDKTCRNRHRQECQARNQQ